MPAGDYVDFYLDIALCNGMLNERTTPEEEAIIREQFGLNRPMIVQYGDWMWSMLTSGDFGYSYAHIDGGSGGREIGPAIREDLPFTIYLSIFTILINRGI